MLTHVFKVDMLSSVILKVGSLDESQSEQDLDREQSTVIILLPNVGVLKTACHAHVLLGLSQLHRPYVTVGL